MESKEMNEERKVCLCTTCSIVALLGIIIFAACFAASFNYVEYNEIAFVRDVYGGVDTSKVYTQGRYFFTINKKFVKFPSIYQEVSSTQSVFTENGLEFDIDFSFQYLLTPENLAAVYNKYSTSYESIIISEARTAIKNTATQFTAENYMSNRTHIERLFAASVSSIIQESVGVDVPTSLFKLIKITFPQTLLDKSLQSILTLQNQQLLTTQQQLAVTEAETNSIVAEIKANTSNVLTFANQEANLVVSSSTNEALRMVKAARGQGLATLLESMGVANSPLRDKFIRVLSVAQNTNNPTILFGDVQSNGTVDAINANFILYKSLE